MVFHNVPKKTEPPCIEFKDYEEAQNLRVLYKNFLIAWPLEVNLSHSLAFRSKPNLSLDELGLDT